MSAENAPSDVVVIQFGNYPNRLVFIGFVGRDRHYEFPINAPFKQVLEILNKEWSETPFPVVFIQEPSTIDALLREYHEYNLLPLPPDHLIEGKITKAEKFYRFISRRFSGLFPESQLVPVKPTIEDYIRHATTGELLPPLGALDPSALHPSDRTYVRAVTAKSQAGASKPSKITVREIKRTYPVHRVKCECCNEWIPCPRCARADLLRGWGAGDRTVTLCYGCGTLFFCDNNDTITQFEGNRDFWGARAIAIVASLNR